MPAIALLPLVAAGWMTLQQPDPPVSVLDAAQVAVTEALQAARAAQVEVTIFNVNFPETITLYVGRDGSVDDATRKQLERTFKCKRTKRQHAIDRGLLVMLADVAARYPGKTIEYVSAYRAVDPRESRHRQGRAFDFRIPGVPLTELRDYVWTHHSEIGVGWYPQSNFIHMDHRPGDKDYAWTQIGATEHGNPYWATKARRAEAAPERPRRGAGA
ncbi:MAG: DUF882 domain-containing protein [Myxococcales bacterium]|nr:DUF882 domain-containing protein [Myxococcales bacterium]MBK7195468.1 DUF882 domain-containing protein [Myxococcales bacterium]MBP6844213.1 DUF882 domain-containing protein [Kofleriaceae bacterium]